MDQRRPADFTWNRIAQAARRGSRERLAQVGEGLFGLGVRPDLGLAGKPAQLVDVFFWF